MYDDMIYDMMAIYQICHYKKTKLNRVQEEKSRAGKERKKEGLELEAQV
jgi:hypothetical protein